MMANEALDMAQPQAQPQLDAPLPAEGATPTQAPEPAPYLATDSGIGQAGTIQPQGESPPPEAPTLKTVSVGLVVLLFIMVGLYFLKNAFVRQQVARKVSPHAANMAGWWLFLLLSSVFAIIVFGIVNQSYFLTPLFIVAALLVMGIALVMLLLSIRIK